MKYVSRLEFVTAGWVVSRVCEGLKVFIAGLGESIMNGECCSVQVYGDAGSTSAFGGRSGMRRVGLLAAIPLALVLWLVTPAVASAESLCTDTWAGPSEGPWITAEDWSTGKVPTSTDVACIGVGKTVKVTGTGNRAGVVQGEGALVIYESSLELTNAIEASSLKALSMVSGTLFNAGVLNVSSSFNWWGGSLSGPGSTVLGPSVTAVVEGTEHLYGGTLVNEGTLTYSEGYIAMGESAEIKNTGTFNANSEEVSGITKGGEGSSLIVNTGIFQKTKGSGKTVVGVAIDNESSISATSGQLEFQGGGTSGQHHVGSWSAAAEAGIVFSAGTYSLGAKVPLSGAITVTDVNTSSSAVVAVGQIEGSAASVIVNTTYGYGGVLEVNGPGASSVAGLLMGSGNLSGAGTLDVSSSVLWWGGKMSGPGSTVLGPGVSGTITGSMTLAGRTLVNEGTLTYSEGYIDMLESAEIKNVGTFNANSEEVSGITKEGGGSPLIVNTGTFQKTKGTGTTRVEVNFENLGVIQELTGKLAFAHLLVVESATQYGGAENPSAPGHPHVTCGKPVSCATGNESESQTDLAVGGRGVGLDLTRYYNSQAGAAGEHGAFGYGWSSSFSDRLVVNKTSKISTLYQANGSTVPFTEGTGGSFMAPAWTQDTLSGSSETGYTLTLVNQVKYKFAGTSGRLESVTDRNGNATTLSYSEAGRLETITDPASRKITFAYNAEGLVESAKDPMGHVVKYVYEGGNLKSVTEPGETGARWQFKYDGSHEITELIDGRGGKTTNEYNGAHQVISQKDPMEHVLSFEYELFRTKIINKATGAVTDEHFTSSDEPLSITRGFGTSSATTQSFSYDAAGNILSVTDGNGHKTRYEYDSAGNRTKMIDANEHETKWTYDSTHDVETMTTPKGEATTIKRDSHGNAESVSRPAPKEATQTTKYTYDSHGDVESMTNPLGRVWKYEYDSYGDRTAEIDPEGDKRTWAYDEDSREVSMVSPRGNVTGGEPAVFTTTIERDAQGRPLIVTEPELHGGGKPSDRTPASIFGVAQEGQTLTASTGIWEGAPSLTYTYQWQRCNASGGSCSAVSGATSATYTLGNGDAGDTMRVVVTASNSAGSASSTSGATGVVSASIPVFSLVFGSVGSGGGQFSAPKEVVVDGGGNEWVTDFSNNRLEKFSSSGTFLLAVGWGVKDGKAEAETCTVSCRAGISGGGNGQFSEPVGIAVGSSTGNLYVVDRANGRVQVLSSTGTFIRAFGTKGSGAGQMSGASGVVLDASENVWVADSENNRIEEFASSGAFTLGIGWGVKDGKAEAETCTTTCQAGIAGSGNGQFHLSHDIALSGGNIYATDNDNNRVEEFNTAGAYLKQFGTSGSGNGQFTNPFSIATESASGSLYVTDLGNNRVEKFNSAGTFLGAFGATGTGNGQFTEPRGIAVNASGAVYTVDSANNRIEEWVKPVSPVFSLVFGSGGSGDGQFRAPKEVAVDGGGNEWVSDFSNNRLEKFSPSGAFLLAVGWGVKDGKAEAETCTSGWDFGWGQWTVLGTCWYRGWFEHGQFVCGGPG